MSINYKLMNDPIKGVLVGIKKTDEDGSISFIPYCPDNIDYQQYLEDIKTHGMSIVSIDDIGYGEPDDSMWQYLDNAEQLIIDKYGSDSDKLTALREHKYVRAIKAEFPYESMRVAGPIIDATPQEIKDKNRHLPMRR